MRRTIKPSGLVLFDQATLAEGDALPDAAAYVGRINRLLLELLDR